MYTEIKNPNRVDLVNSPFGGRYCGHIPPRLRISLYSSIIISFYTDFTNTSSDLFLASYKFFNGCKYKWALGGSSREYALSLPGSRDRGRRGSGPARAGGGAGDLCDPLVL